MTSPPLLRAVVLRTRPYSETSLWVRLYSESHGKVTGIAKGGRKGVSRMFSPLLEVEVRGYPPKSAEHGLWNLSRPEIICDWRGLASDARRMAYAFGVLEVCDRLLEEGEPHPPLYRAMHHVLVALESGSADVGACGLAWFLVRLTDELGYSIQYQICPRCQSPLVFPVGAFAHQAGGVLCKRCSPSDAYALARPLWEVLVMLAESLRPPDLKWDAGIRDAILHLLMHYLAYHSERPVQLRSLDLLAEFRRNSS